METESLMRSLCHSIEGRVRERNVHGGRVREITDEEALHGGGYTRRKQTGVPRDSGSFVGQRVDKLDDSTKKKIAGICALYEQDGTFRRPESSDNPSVGFKLQL